LGIDIAVSIPAVRVITFVTQLLDLHCRRPAGGTRFAAATAPS